MTHISVKVPANRLIDSKIVTKESLAVKLGIWRFKGRRIVFTNGCFDLLHRGHIDYLAKASDLGDVLVVAINTDESVKKLNKGAARPIQDEQSRASILASLFFVDAVILFDDNTPIDLIEFVQPNTLVKGADYDAEETSPKSGRYIVGSDIVKGGGGIVTTIDLLEGYSTSAIEEKIRKLK